MNVPITPQQLPVGFCPPDYQTMWNAFAAAGFVNIPDALSPVIWQASKPVDSTVTWGQLDSLGRPVRIYKFAQGAWLSLHPQVPGQTIWWFNALPDFTVFDGGDANPISDISGPMWQQAKDINGNLIAAMFPIPPGTLPSGTVIQIGNTGGEEQHTLLPAEVPPHTHFVSNNDQVTTGSSTSTPATSANTVARSFSNGHDNQDYGLGGTSNPAVVGLSSNFGGNGATPPVTTPHNTMPPYTWWGSCSKEAQNFTTRLTDALHRPKSQRFKSARLTRDWS